jgi:hypothetical protein
MQIRSFHFVVAMLAGWLRRQQEAVIDYLKEENKVLREQMGAGGYGSLTHSGVDWHDRASLSAGAACVLLAAS